MRLKKKYEIIKEWFLGQDKYMIKYNVREFELRDLRNKITVGWFDTWWSAAEFTYDLVHAQLVIPDDRR